MPVIEEDVLSPFQPYLSEMFGGDGSLAANLLEFCHQGLPDPPALAATSARFSIVEMASPRVLAQFLALLIKLTRSSKALEIGTFVGATSLVLARALSEPGRLVTLEKGQEFAEIARENFAANSAGRRIKLFQGDALALLPTLQAEAPFDFVFLDGGKELYWELFQAAEPLMGPGSLIVADDVFFAGDALNSTPQTEKGEGVKRFVSGITASDKWCVSILPVFNGILLGQMIGS